MKKVLLYKNESSISYEKKKLAQGPSRMQKVVDAYLKIGYGKLGRDDLADLINDPHAFVFENSNPSNEVKVLSFQKEKIYDFLERPPGLNELLSVIENFKVERMRSNNSLAYDFSFFEVTTDQKVVIRSEAIRKIEEQHSFYVEDDEGVEVLRKLETIKDLCNDLVHLRIAPNAIFECVHTSFMGEKFMLDREKVLNALGRRQNRVAPKK